MLKAAQARSSACALAAATARRVTASLVNPSLDTELLRQHWHARSPCDGGSNGTLASACCDGGGNSKREAAATAAADVIARGSRGTCQYTLNDHSRQWSGGGTAAATVAAQVRMPALGSGGVAAMPARAQSSGLPVDAAARRQQQQLQLRYSRLPEAAATRRQYPSCALANGEAAVRQQLQRQPK